MANSKPVIIPGLICVDEQFFDHESEMASLMKSRSRWLKIGVFSTLLAVVGGIASIAFFESKGAEAVGLVLPVILGLLAFCSFIICFELRGSIRGTKNQVREMGLAAGIFPALCRSISHYNRQVSALSDFVNTKEEFGLENDESMQVAIERKVTQLTSMHDDLLSKLNLAKKLYGVQEGKFDNLAEVLFSEDPEALESIDKMLKGSIQRLSARVEVEEDVAVVSIDRARKRLRNG